MFVHHVVTLCLLGFSWACNLVRIGTLVLIIHDFADIPLEGAKLMTYVKKQRLADSIFVVFTTCWMVSRIGLLPYRNLLFVIQGISSGSDVSGLLYIQRSVVCIASLAHSVDVVYSEDRYSCRQKQWN